MKKVISIAACAALFIGLAVTPANAHVGTQTRGNSLVAGTSSRIY